VARRLWSDLIRVGIDEEEVGKQLEIEGVDKFAASYLKVLDIIEAQSVHTLRSSVPQPSYGEIGDAQGISKQAARIRQTEFEQVHRVHQMDGHRHGAPAQEWHASKRSYLCGHVDRAIYAS